MKPESTLIAIARNLMSKGYSEEDARYEMVDRYPDDEGTILTMVIQNRDPKVDHQIETLAAMQTLGETLVASTPAIDAPSEDAVVAWVEEEAQADQNALIQTVLAQPVDFQAEVFAALLKSLPAAVVQKMVAPVKPEKPVPPAPVKAKAPNSTTKSGRARILFLAAEDRSVKALSDLFMQEIGWVRGDANYYAKQFIAEFESGKLQ